MGWESGLVFFGGGTSLVLGGAVLDLTTSQWVVRVGLSWEGSKLELAIFKWVGRAGLVLCSNFGNNCLMVLDGFWSFPFTGPDQGNQGSQENKFHIAFVFPIPQTRPGKPRKPGTRTFQWFVLSSHWPAQIKGTRETNFSMAFALPILQPRPGKPRKPGKPMFHGFWFSHSPD